MLVNLGERIKAARERAGVTQGELAKLIGLKGKQGISNWERSRALPNLDMISLLAFHLNVPLGYFWGEADISDKVTFVDPDGNAVALDPDDELVISYKKCLDPDVSGVKLTPRDIVDVARARQECWEFFPHVKDYWPLLEKLLKVDSQLGEFVSAAKISDAQALIIATAIRKELNYPLK